MCVSVFTPHPILSAGAVERSRSDVGLKATHDSNAPCSTVTISWAEQRGACGSYSNVLEYYIANDSSTIRSIPVPPNATYLKLTAKEFSPETEYEFRLKVSYTSVDGDTLRESTSDPAQLYIPYCQQGTLAGLVLEVTGGGGDCGSGE